MPYANNKGADQPAHPRSLISAFVVHCLDSMISLVSISEIPSLLLVSEAEQASLSYLVANPEDRFSHEVAHIRATSRENVSTGIFKQVRFKPACSATES